eukprot:gene28600-35475_t
MEKEVLLLRSTPSSPAPPADPLAERRALQTQELEEKNNLLRDVQTELQAKLASALSSAEARELSMAELQAQLARVEQEMAQGLLATYQTDDSGDVNVDRDLNVLCIEPSSQCTCLEGDMDVESLKHFENALQMLIAEGRQVAGSASSGSPSEHSQQALACVREGIAAWRQERQLLQASMAHSNMKMAELQGTVKLTLKESDTLRQTSQEKDAQIKSLSESIQQFDGNQDGKLNKEELMALMRAVNPHMAFTGDHLQAIVTEVFSMFPGGGGLPFE